MTLPGSARCLEAFGQYPEEPVSGGVTEVVVDGLQAIHVEEQDRYRTGTSWRQTGFQVGQQCPAVVDPGEVVVFCEMTKLLLGLDPSLYLCEQRCRWLPRR